MGKSRTFFRKNPDWNFFKCKNIQEFDSLAAETSTKITKFVLLEAVELVEIVEVDLVVVEPLAPITATSSGQGGNQQLPKSGEVQVSFQSQATGKFWTPLNDILICVPLTPNLDV